MPLLRADVTLPYVTGLPRDVAINTFHFAWTGTGDPTELTPVLANFYNVAQGGATNDIAHHIGVVVSRESNACSVKVYDAEEEGPPLYIDEFTLGAPVGSASPLPLEVAACLSYRSNVSGLTAARQRGRIYIGPLSTNGIVTSADSLPIMTEAFCESLVGAGEYLAYNSTLLAEGLVWSVYSRVGGNVSPIVGGWVDNEFDTQRRRQAEATQRYTWAAVVP